MGRKRVRRTPSHGRVGFLLIHGVSGSPAEMSYIANGLARNGHVVAVPQLAADASWESWLATAEDSLAGLRKRCSHVFVGGLSAGGVLALKVAARHPDIVRGVVSYAPALHLDGWSMPWYTRLLPFALTRRVAGLLQVADISPFGLKDADARAKAGLRTLTGNLMFELKRLVASLRRDLPHVRQPALIVHPREDDRTSLESVVDLQHGLGGRVEVVVLNDSYHLVTLDRQRSIVLARTMAFARNVLASIDVSDRSVKPGQGTSAAIA